MTYYKHEVKLLLIVRSELAFTTHLSVIPPRNSESNTTSYMVSASFCARWMPTIVPRSPKGTEKPSRIFTTRSNSMNVTPGSGMIPPCRKTGCNTHTYISKQTRDILSVQDRQYIIWLMTDTKLHSHQCCTVLRWIKLRLNHYSLSVLKLSNHKF